MGWSTVVDVRADESISLVRDGHSPAVCLALDLQEGDAHALRGQHVAKDALNVRLFHWRLSRRA